MFRILQHRAGKSGRAQPRHTRRPIAEAPSRRAFEEGSLYYIIPCKKFQARETFGALQMRRAFAGRRIFLDKRRAS
ncbi:MAG: hypothetical protein DBY36_03165 [Clostridiales bacterium]|nr:MAG: hypothetical protein DBY36_03165 [Clostridiales bacterium]